MQISKETFIAVLLPTFNSMPWVQETAASINKQTFRDFIVIAIDDASTDLSYDFLLSVKEQFPQQWFVYKNKKRLGMVRNWNQCLKMQKIVASKAEYIIKIDSDDLISKNLLEKGFYELTKHKEAVACCFKTLEISKQKSIKSTEQLKILGIDHKRSNDLIINSEKMLRYFIKYDNFISSSGIIFRKSSLGALDKPCFDEYFEWAPDFDLWSRLACIGPIIYISDAVVQYRTRKDNITSITMPVTKRREARIISIKTFIRSLKILGMLNILVLLPVVVYKIALLCTDRRDF